MQGTFRLFALVVAAVVPLSAAAAQEGATITGRVTSEAGVPLASASVFVDGLNIGALTREDGVYSFVVPAGRVHRFAIGRRRDPDHPVAVATATEELASRAAVAKTVNSIRGVSRPVLVFWRLGWYDAITAGPVAGR